MSPEARSLIKLDDTPGPFQLCPLMRTRRPFRYFRPDRRRPLSTRCGHSSETTERRESTHSCPWAKRRYPLRDSPGSGGPFARGSIRGGDLFWWRWILASSPESPVVFHPRQGSFALTEARVCSGQGQCNGAVPHGCPSGLWPAPSSWRRTAVAVSLSSPTAEGRHRQEQRRLYAFLAGRGSEVRRGVSGHSN